MSKVFLILIDGMRPDSLAACNHPFYRELLATGRWSLRTRTVMPSVTLPCHMSLFHSVAPDRHGTVTNTYVPQVRPIKGLCEVLDGAGKMCAFFYDWEPLRDLTRPGSLAGADFISGRKAGYPVADKILTERIEAMLESGNTPDFTFFYICWVDEAGHKYGWMSPEYIESVKLSLDCAAKVASRLDPEVKLILTADHGGHDRCHGTEMPEDMTIPLFIRYKGITPGEISGESSILDIAPTVTEFLGVPADPDWEGRVLELR